MYYKIVKKSQEIWVSIKVGIKAALFWMKEDYYREDIEKVHEIFTLKP